MTCRDALERMMEAEPAVLEGAASADAALAEHLRGCGRCRAVADVLARELAALDAGLGELASPGADPREQLRPRFAVSGTRVWKWIPLAAAALAAVLLLGRSGPPPGGGPGPAELTAEDREPRATTLAVTLPENRGAAVMSTRNPKITVVWLYERSER
ncbi:MAG: hypothetical protein KY466_08350 [Gemmatimonadetes bacterium]|nr:hypothetical protein [Gemmatimonadota bacterium]